MAGLEWASFFFGSMCLPPDPVLVGDRWRAIWLERLQSMPLFFEPWLRHQRRDAYWKHGSVCEDYEAIQCPVYAVGGWTDGYKNAIPRLLERLTVPRKGLIGPWAHGYPHFALPGPSRSPSSVKNSRRDILPAGGHEGPAIHRPGNTSFGGLCKRVNANQFG